MKSNILEKNLQENIMQVVIDDNLMKTAQQLSGLSDCRTVIEESLRLFIEKQQQANDVAGSLSHYARSPALSFAQERELAWSKTTDEASNT